MKFTKSLSNRFPKFARYISLPLILFFTIPPIFLIGFGGEAGKYIGLSMFMIIGGYTMYEVFANMKMSKYSAIYLGMTITILFFLPWIHINSISDYGIKDIIDLNSKSLPTLSSIFLTLFSWRTIMIFLGSILLPIIFDPYIRGNKKILQDTSIIIIVSFVVGFFAKGIFIVNIYNWSWVFFFVSISIISDTFGFFGGMLFGKKWFKGAKLAPRLSPKKTWAGFVIGYFFSALFIGIAGWYMHIFANTYSEISFLIVSTILIPIVSPFGDLLFSGIKRYLGTKDFSNLLPGHGGAADRLDAMATVMFFIIVLFIIF